MTRRYPLEPFRRLTGWSLKRIGEVAPCNAEHAPFRFDGEPVTDDNAVGCRVCHPRRGGWPCDTRMIADDLREALR